MKNVSILSFGAGVQSTTLLVMACLGDIKKVDHVVFSDTGWEPQNVYDHLEWCKKFAKKYGIEIEITSNGNLRNDIIYGKENNKRFASIPFFTLGEYPIFEDKKEVDENQLELFEFEIEEKQIIKGYEVRKGMVRRQCTNEYKIIPIRRACRKFAGLKHGERAKDLNIDLLMGISTDEIQRVKPSQERYITHRYPLIDKNFSRNDCLNYIKEKGLPTPPKSSCIGCPFHNDVMWKDMKLNDSVSWEEAILIDKQIRKLPRFKGQAFLHKSCKPLDEIDFGTDQLDIDDFANECTGSCGV